MTKSEASSKTLEWERQSSTPTRLLNLQIVLLIFDKGSLYQKHFLQQPKPASPLH